MRGLMAPPPGRRFPYRDGVQPALQRVHLLRGVAYHNRREPNLYPVGAHWMLLDAPYALGCASSGG